MQVVCDLLEQILKEGVLSWVMTPEHLAAIALSVGRPKDRARLVYLFALVAFDRARFVEILDRHGLQEQWLAWSTALGI